MCYIHMRYGLHIIHITCSTYGVATISRLLKIIGLFYRISFLSQGSFAKETYDFKEPTTCSYPIVQHHVRKTSLLHSDLYNTLQLTATHCNIMDSLQHATTRYNTLQHTATHCNTLQHTAPHCTKLSCRPFCSYQTTATHCNAHCNTRTNSKPKIQDATQNYCCNYHNIATRGNTHCNTRTSTLTLGNHTTKFIALCIKVCCSGVIVAAMTTATQLHVYCKTCTRTLILDKHSTKSSVLQQTAAYCNNCSVGLRTRACALTFACVHA